MKKPELATTFCHSSFVRECLTMIQKNMYTISKNFFLKYLNQIETERLIKPELNTVNFLAI